MTTKTCPKCKQNMSPEHFYTDRSKKSGLTSRCRICILVHYHANRTRILDRVSSLRTKQTTRTPGLRVGRPPASPMPMSVNAIVDQTASDPKPPQSRGQLDQVRESCLAQVRALVLSPPYRDSHQTIMGCLVREARHHISSQFSDGMTWDNIGDVWDISHRSGPADYDLLSVTGRADFYRIGNFFPKKN